MKHVCVPVYIRTHICLIPLSTKVCDWWNSHSLPLLLKPVICLFICLWCLHLLLIQLHISRLFESLAIFSFIFLPLAACSSVFYFQSQLSESFLKIQCNMQDDDLTVK